MKCKDCSCMIGKRGNLGQKECKKVQKTLRGALVYAYIDVNPEDECHYKEEKK